ncbi:MAG: DUF4167 domain-containing protein [Roseitalea porphyridii]|jgi:hypothetical protein|uniref:DUF4167 domain-containing protein n=1 Tax=Alphaproteobacteria TaxID=28211 RepID=UPI0032EE52FF
MRPQQQGRRSRNRGGGRRNQNPLQRSYESNGPDVKIRGNAQVIADKYATLARDALSSGDSVMAENYLQHAEHYNRIILAAQPAQQRDDRDDRDDDDGDQNDGQQSANGEDRQAQGSKGQGQKEQGQKDQGPDDGQNQGGRQRRRRDRSDEDGQQDSGERAARSKSGDDDKTGGDSSGSDASEMPQPVIEGTPAEVRQEQAEQQAAADKPKRARRPRKKADDGETGGPDEGSDRQERPVAAE